jgi:hypothetical protein
MLPRLIPEPQLVGMMQLNAAVERITFVAGPLLAALVLRGWDVDGGFITSAVLLAVTSVLLGIRLVNTDEELPRPPEPTDRASGASSWTIARRQPALLLLAGGLFMGAALAICLKVVLVELAAEPLDRSDEMLGVLLAVVGAGTMLGPLSVPRLLGHFPVSLIVTGSAMGIAAGIVLISIVTRFEIVTLVLLGIGLISITNDMVTAAVARRISPEAELPGTGRLMLAAVIAGQIVAALVVALFTRVWDSTDVMLAFGIASALVMGLLCLAADGGSLVPRRTVRS